MFHDMISGISTGIRMRKFCLAILLSTLIAGPAFAARCGGDFNTFVAAMSQEAAAAGVSQGVIAQAFGGVTQDQAVLSFDRRQRYTFNKTFEQYVSTRVGSVRINGGRAMLKRYADVLSSIEAKYGVPRQILVAIWGLETDFGKGDMGKLPVIRTLTTLAHDCRRTELFQGELLAALKILQRGDLPLRDLIGAYAGEIGQTQFLPSSYIKYGVDFDGDGRVDLRHSVPDVLASTANLLQRLQDGGALRRRHRQLRSDARVESRADLSQDDRVFCRSVGGAVATHTVIPGRAMREPGIHSPCVSY
jgi:lytic murein transglycosylase